MIHVLRPPSEAMQAFDESIVAIKQEFGSRIHTFAIVAMGADGEPMTGYFVGQGVLAESALPYVVMDALKERIAAETDDAED